MVAPLIAAAGISAGGSILGGLFGSSAASKAAKAQAKAAQMQVEEQRRQFDTTQQNFEPYLDAGTGALGDIRALLGIASPSWGNYVTSNPDIMAEWNNNVAKSGRFKDISDFGQWHYQNYGQAEGRDISAVGGDGAAAQQAAIDKLKGGPLYQSLYRNGEQAILSNAAATGGLRGGNTQGALYNLGADTLSNVIQQQLSNLGGIANMGQGAAGSLGTFGANAANQIGQAYTQQGQAQAGSALAKGGIFSGIANNLSSLLANTVQGRGINSYGVQGGNIF